MKPTTNELIVLEELRDHGATRYAPTSIFYRTAMSCVRKGWAECVDERVIGNIRITAQGRKVLG